MVVRLKGVRFRDVPTDGALGEGTDAGQTQVGQSFADVGLRHAQFDAALLEAFGEGLQLAWVRLVVVQRQGHGAVAAVEVGVVLRQLVAG